MSRRRINHLAAVAERLGADTAEYEVSGTPAVAAAAEARAEAQRAALADRLAEADAIALAAAREVASGLAMTVETYAAGGPAGPAAACAAALFREAVPPPPSPADLRRRLAEIAAATAAAFGGEIARERLPAASYRTEIEARLAPPACNAGAAAVAHQCALAGLGLLDAGEYSLAREALAAAKSALLNVALGSSAGREALAIEFRPRAAAGRPVDEAERAQREADAIALAEAVEAQRDRRGTDKARIQAALRDDEARAAPTFSLRLAGLSVSQQQRILREGRRLKGISPR